MQELAEQTFLLPQLRTRGLEVVETRFEAAQVVLHPFEPGVELFGRQTRRRRGGRGRLVGAYPSGSASSLPSVVPFSSRRPWPPPRGAGSPRTRSRSIASRCTRDRPRTRVGRNRATATAATAVAPPQFRSPVASTGPFRPIPGKSRIGSRIARQTEETFGDHVALDVAGAARDGQAAVEQERRRPRRVVTLGGRRLDARPRSSRPPGRAGRAARRAACGPRPPSPTGRRRPARRA